eukprot:4226335-Amphidinium_carterae.2
MHTINGNGGKGRGKGGKGGKRASADPQLSPLDPAVRYQNELLAALPDAAKLRTYPELLSVFSVPTVRFDHLGTAGGVAYVRRQDVPRVIKSVGYTHAPAAMVCGSSARDLNLPGYASAPVWVHVRVTEGAERRDVHMERHLVQLSFGSPVALSGTGDIFDLPKCGVRLVAKASPASTLSVEELTVRSFTEWVSKHISLAAFTDFLQRRDSLTVYIQHELADNALRLSGESHWLIKPHQDEKMEMHLLWLADGTTQAEAYGHATADACVLGLAAKSVQAGLTTRYALRFREENQMLEHATRLGVQEQLEYGRYKATGITSKIGIVGCHQVLQQCGGFKVDEIIYLDGFSCVFHATYGGKSNWQVRDSKGNIAPVQVKAVNAKARQFMEDYAKTQRAAAPATSASTTRPSTLQQAQQQLLQLRAVPAPAVHSPRGTTRPREAHPTGMSPPSAKPKAEGKSDQQPMETEAAAAVRPLD